MRQFILAKTFGTVVPPTVANQVSVVYADSSTTGTGVTAIAANGTVPADKNLFQILCGSGNSNIAPQTIPICRNNFSYSKSEYVAGVNKKVTVTPAAITASTSARTFAIIVAVKGLKFNERNKWTADLYVPAGKTLTAAQVATKLYNEFEPSLKGIGINVTNPSGTVVFEGTDYIDFSVFGAEEYMGEVEKANGVIVVTTALTVPQNDAKMIGAMADAAAADAGIQGTYKEASEYMHPTFPFNPLSATAATDYGFTVYTLRFTEPRATSTITTAVNQVVQIAVPNSAPASESSAPTAGAACAGIENFIGALAGTTVTSGTVDKTNTK